MTQLCRAAPLTLILLACGPGIEPGDAGADTGDAGDTSIEIAPPDIPWLEDGVPPIAPPMLTPCPEGWHEVLQVDPADPAGEMDVVTCDPYGREPYGTEPDICPEGQAHFPGDPGCTPVGASCPTGDFPEGLPADRAVIYVLAGAPPGGDGSESSPLSTITLGLAGASRGAIVAVGKGEYDEALRLPPGVTLWGACARETRLTASTWGPLAQGIITAPGADTRVANLWVGPSELPGIVAYGDRASLSLDGVIIDGSTTIGLRVTNGARVDGRELVVSGTRAGDAGRFGRGIGVDFAGTLDLRRGWISQNHDIGVFAEHGGTSLALSDVVIRGTQARESDGTKGRGLSVQRGATATATVTRTLLSWNHELGVYTSDEGTSLALSDVVIRDTQAQESDGASGRGVALWDGATMTVARALLARNRELGVYATGEGTSMILSDVVVQGTLPQESDGTAGRGLNVQLGAVTVTRARLFGNREVGVFVGGDNTSVALTDVVVRDTQAQESDGSGGRGLSVELGATATAIRALFSRNHDTGVLADGDGTSLVFSDVVIEGTEARESDDRAGRGFGVQRGATATLTRALLSRNRDVGVFAASLGTVVELVDVAVTRTEAQACADTTCVDQPFGIGLLGTHEASLSATRFAVQDGALCGVMVAEDAQVDLAIGKVSGFRIGVCLQVDGYSVPRLTDQVRYVDNDTNLDTTSLPVPELADPIDGTR